MSPFIAIAAAILTFFAFWVQYKANEQQKIDLKVERFENKFYELLRKIFSVERGYRKGVIGAMVKKIQKGIRRHTRIIFNERNRVRTAVALQQQPAQQTPAAVLNMSEGGMQVSIERKKFQNMRQGNIVLLSRITGIPELESLKDLLMRVIWIMDNQYLEHVLLGMSFSSLSEKDLEILQSFIAHRLALAAERGKRETSSS